MTIRPGEPWGELVPRPPDVRRAATDAAVAAALGGDGPPVLITGGDLYRTIGGRSSHDDGDRAQVLAVPIDTMVVTVDGRAELVAVAHVVVAGARGVGRLLSGGLLHWRHPTVVVANAEFVGVDDVAPRAHPDDGRLDVVEVDPAMPWRARRAANVRMRSGTHLPHPLLHTRRVREVGWSFDGGRQVAVDGVDIGTVTRLDVRLVADSATVLVAV